MTEIFGFNLLTLIIIVLFAFLIISIVVDLIHDVKSHKNIEDNSTSLHIEE